MIEYDHTGNKTKNYFIAYLQKCIRWKRQNYLRRKEDIRNMEKPLEENAWVDSNMTMGELPEMKRREELLLKEQKGIYPDWVELSDQRLISALMLLREDERQLIYQHIFEERTFEEIGDLNSLTGERVKGIYYYAIRKIRKWMGARDNGI